MKVFLCQCRVAVVLLVNIKLKKVNADIQIILSQALYTASGIMEP